MPGTGLTALIQILHEGLTQRPSPLSRLWVFSLSAFVSKLTTLPNKKPQLSLRVFVPGTGFEPAQPFGCCHLKTVRLPVSPPGLEMFEVSGLKFDV